MSTGPVIHKTLVSVISNCQTTQPLHPHNHQIAFQTQAKIFALLILLCLCQSTKEIVASPSSPHHQFNTMNITASSFGDQYQEIVIQMVDNGLSESEILKSLEENYSVTISRRTLSRRKEDWGLTNHAAQQIHSLEETITKHFEDGLTYAQIHHAISTSHNYTHSEQTMVRQLNSMQLSRRLDDLDRNLTTAEMAVSCIMALHQTPEGRNAGYRKMRQLLQTQYGINLHKLAMILSIPHLPEYILT
jgi:hypothetical protein